VVHLSCRRVWLDNSQRQCFREQGDHARGRWCMYTGPMNRKSAIIIGVGPVRGLGAQLCHRFAAEGLHVVVPLPSAAPGLGPLRSTCGRQRKSG